MTTKRLRLLKIKSAESCLARGRVSRPLNATNTLPRAATPRGILESRDGERRATL